MLIWSVPLLLFVILNFAVRSNASGDSPEAVDAALRQAMPAGDTLWIDVRTPEEYAAGRLDEAINLPLSAIEQTLPQFEPDKERIIALYCRSGNRSSQALSIAKKLGYRSAFNAGAFSNLASSRQK